MIFVTVGTHEQPFNRLIKKVDDLIIKEKVIVQTGFSTYIPEYCEAHKMMSFEKMQQTLRDARIVITHGGQSAQENNTSDAPVTTRRKHIFSSNNWVWKGPKTQSSPQQPNATAPTDLQTTEDKNADSNEGGNDERP